MTSAIFCIALLALISTDCSCGPSGKKKECSKEKICKEDDLKLYPEHKRCHAISGYPRRSLKFGTQYSLFDSPCGLTIHDCEYQYKLGMSIAKRRKCGPIVNSCNGIVPMEELPAGGETYRAVRDALLEPNNKMFNRKASDGGREDTTLAGYPSIRRHRDGTVTGLLPPRHGKYTIRRLAEALYVANFVTLSKALDLEEIFERRGIFKVFTHAFQRLIVSQSQEKINYETAMFVLEMLLDVAPETVTAMKVISYVIMRLQELDLSKGEKKKYMYDMFSDALKFFYGYDNPQAEEMLRKISDLIYQANEDPKNEEAAKQIVTYLEFNCADFQTLLKRFDQEQLLRATIALVEECTYVVDYDAQV